MGALYAQTVIEGPRVVEPTPDGENVVWEGGERYAPGDQVPADLPGIEELKESGAVSGSKPEVREVAAGDAATAGDESG